MSKKLRSKRFLLLELGMSQVRLHSVDATRTPIRLNLIAQESTIPGDIALLIESARKALDAGSTINDHLVIIMNSPAIHHHIIAIPSVSVDEREKIVHLEMKRFATPGEAAAVTSFWPAGKIKENGVIKEYVLAAMMPGALSEALISLTQEKKLNLIGFTSHPQITSNLLKECRLNSVSNLAMVEVNDHGVSITLFHSNIWNMERQFQLGPNAPPGMEKPVSMEMDKLKLELGRALQYFKQQVRNENISQIFLYGTTSQGNAIKTFLEDSFRIPVSLLTVDGKKFAVQDGSVLLSAPHVAALYSNFEKYIDFLPAGWRRKRQIKIGKIAVAAAAAALYLLLAGVGYLFKDEASQIEKSEKTHAQAGSAPAELDVSTQKIYSDRMFALASEKSADWMRKRHNVLVNFARELAQSMPAEMRITALDASEKENKWSIKIEAEICSRNGSRSQELFLRFQDRIRTHSGINDLNWGAIQLADSAPDSAARNTLTFSLQGSIPLNPKT